MSITCCFRTSKRSCAAATRLVTAWNICDSWRHSVPPLHIKERLITETHVPSGIPLSQTFWTISAAQTARQPRKTLAPRFSIPTSFAKPTSFRICGYRRRRSASHWVCDTKNFGQVANTLPYPAFAGFDPNDFLKPNRVNTDNNNFGPAFGLAWSPALHSGWLNKLFGENKTVWRGGFQVSYEGFYTQMLSLNLAATPPNGSRTSSPDEGRRRRLIA